jgi:hypothetical protein
MKVEGCGFDVGLEHEACSSARGLVNNVIFFCFVWGGVVCGFPFWGIGSVL